MDTKNTTPLDLAAEIAGGVPALAKELGLSFQAVYKWVGKGAPPDKDRCKAVSAAVNGRVSWIDLLEGTFTTPPPARRADDKRNHSESKS